MKLAHTLKVLAVAGLALVLGACRGGTSEKPPVHIVLDMDFQQKLKTQAKAEFDGWTDGRAMRLPVAGTVARESLPDPKLLPDPRNPGKGTDGAYLKSNPLEATAANLARGREPTTSTAPSATVSPAAAATDPVATAWSASSGRSPCPTSTRRPARTTASPTSPTASTSR